MRSILIVIGVLLLGALLLGGKLIGNRNELVVKREAIEASWAQVDVALQRRSDLIPNLVSTVKGYATQEKEIFTNIANARSALSGARTNGEKIAANSQLDSALARLLVVVENYPQLKSNENFMALQSQLEGTENRIAIARRDYNDAVRVYNTTLRTFPQVIWAKTVHGGSKPMELFQATAAAQSAPTVDFAPAAPQAAPPAGAAPGSPPPK